MIINNSTLLEVDNSIAVATIKHLLVDKDTNKFLSAYDLLQNNQKFFVLLGILDVVPDVTKEPIKRVLSSLKLDLIDIKTWNKPGNTPMELKEKVFRKITSFQLLRHNGVYYTN